MNSDNILSETGLTSKIIANYAPKQSLHIAASEKTEPMVETSANYTVGKLEPNIDPGSNGTSFLDSLTGEDGSRNKTVSKMEALFKVTSCELQNFETGSPQEEFKTRPNLLKSHSTGGTYPCEPPTSKGRPRKHPYKPGKYQCNYCGALCAKPSVLEKHIRAHTNERPFPCHLCKIDFKTKSNLSKHEKSKSHYLKMEIHKSEPNSSSGNQDIKPNFQQDTKCSSAVVMPSSILTPSSNTSTENVRKMALSLVTAASGCTKQDMDLNASMSDTRSDLDPEELETEESLVNMPGNILTNKPQTTYSTDNTSLIGVLTVAGSGGETIQVPVQLDSSFFRSVSVSNAQSINSSNSIDTSYNSIRILGSNQDVSSLNGKDTQGMTRSDADLLAAQSILQLAANEKDSLSTDSPNIMMQSSDKLCSNNTSLASQQSSWMSQSSTNSLKSVKISRNSLVSQQAVDHTDPVEIQVVNLNDFSELCSDTSQILKSSDMLELPKPSNEGETDNSSPPTFLVSTNRSDQQLRKKNPKLIMIGKNPSMDLEDVALQPQISADNLLSLSNTSLNTVANIHLLKPASLDSLTLKQSHSLDSPASLNDAAKKSSINITKKFYSQESESKLLSMDSSKELQSVKMLLKDKILKRSKSVQPAEDSGSISTVASVNLMSPTLPISSSENDRVSSISISNSTMAIKSQPFVNQKTSGATTTISKPQFIFLNNSSLVQPSLQQGLADQSGVDTSSINLPSVNSSLQSYQTTSTSSYSSGIAPPPKKRRLEQISTENFITKPESNILNVPQKLTTPLITVSSTQADNIQPHDAATRDMFFVQSSNMADSNLTMSLPTSGYSSSASNIKYYSTISTPQGSIILVPCTMDTTASTQINQPVTIVSGDNNEEGNMSQAVSTSQLIIDMLGNNSVVSSLDTMSAGYQTNPLVASQMVQLVSNHPQHNIPTSLALHDSSFDYKLSVKQEDSGSYLQNNRPEMSHYDAPVTIMTVDNLKASSVPSSPTKLAKILPKSEPLELKPNLTSSITAESGVQGGPNSPHPIGGQYVRGKGRGKYQCPDCGVRCIKPCMLRKHSLIHSSLRPYICSHCDQRFKTKGNLKKHMKSKAHYEKCVTDLKMSEVPTVVDENTQIDRQALNSRIQLIKEGNQIPGLETDAKSLEEHSSNASDSESNELTLESPEDNELSKNSMNQSNQECSNLNTNENVKISGSSPTTDKEDANMKTQQTSHASSEETVATPDNVKNNESSSQSVKSEQVANVLTKSLIKPENHLPPNVNAIEMPQDMPLNLSSARLRPICKDEDTLSKEQAWKHIEAAIKAVNPNQEDERPLEGIDLLTNNIPAHSVQTVSTSNQDAASSPSRNVEVEQVFSQEKQNGITCQLCNKRCDVRNYQLHLQVHRFTGEDGPNSNSAASSTTGKDSNTDCNDADNSSVDPSANKPQSGNSSTTEGTTDPRPFKCVVCSIGFRVCGHLSKHYRSKTHLNNLASAGLLTTSLLSEIELNKVPIHEIIDQETGNLIPQILSRYVSNKWGRKVSEEDANSCSSSTIENSDCVNADIVPTSSPNHINENLNDHHSLESNKTDNREIDDTKTDINDEKNEDRKSIGNSDHQSDNEISKVDETSELCDSPPLIVCDKPI